MSILLLITSFLVFTALITTVTFKYGIQKSISESYYRFNGLGKALFTFAIWGFTVPLMIVADSGIFFIAGSFLCFVGGAAAFKSSQMELDVHLIGAFGGIILAFTSLWLDFNLYPITIVFICLTVFLYLMKDVLKYIWWIEVAAYYLMLLGLIIVKL